MKSIAYIDGYSDGTEKPGRDPRKQVQVLEFDANIRQIEDLQSGMELPAS